MKPSDLPGKLRKHPDDPHQFATDDRRWFLHIGDTGYRYVVDTEPNWKAYIDQAAEAGFTKVRTWFCRGRSDVQALYNKGRKGLDLAYWDEIDRRLLYALDTHPHVIFQLIPFGEDTEELARYAEGDDLTRNMVAYAQARFSALPNVTWCISNDRYIKMEPGPNNIPAETIDLIGRDMADREPWGTLITNHQRRFSGYAFVDAPWSDIVTLEDRDQVAGTAVLKYRAMSDDPVVLDEDRYGNYISPAHDRYFFRRLIWANLLSGGHATYGGLNTYEPFDGTLRGMHGYRDAVESGRLDDGAHDFGYIHQFFHDAGFTLVGMKPDDAMAGDDPSDLQGSCGRPSHPGLCPKPRHRNAGDRRRLEHERQGPPPGPLGAMVGPLVRADQRTLARSEGLIPIRWREPRPARPVPWRCRAFAGA